MYLIFLVSILVFTFGYFVYARYISKIMGINLSNPVPSVEKTDGIDYVPTNKFILFGHHFASIAGAGPILGPIIAISMYGWGPVWLWVLIGGVFLGGVHDFLSMIISVRNEGKSIFDISKTSVGKSTSLFMLIFVFVALVIVVAVFAAYTANTFIAEPRIVIPTFTILLAAIILSIMIYKLNWNILASTIFTLTLVILSIYLSFVFNWSITLPFDRNISLTIWISVLLAYSFIASTLPVNLILQPRDYLNSFILILGILFGILGIVIMGSKVSNISLPFFSITDVAKDPKTGLVEPLWPILFITVACGAISGFHSLVASGTSSKQVANEKDIKFVSYGGMITESTLAIIVIIGAIFFLSHNELINLVKEGKSIIAFGKSYGELTSLILGGWGLSFAIFMLNGFMLTTLDTATRISRFLFEELYTSVSGLKINKYISTTIIVLLAGYLSLSGAYLALWKLFGTANQLVAALALVVISVYLMKKSIKSRFAIIPAIFMVTTTLGALIFYFYKYAFDSFNLTFLTIDTVLLIIAIVSYIGVIVSLVKNKKETT